MNRMLERVARHLSFGHSSTGTGTHERAHEGVGPPRYDGGSPEERDYQTLGHYTGPGPGNASP